MSIANELSSDVAAAVLARREDGSSQSVRDLVGVVEEVHATLRRLTAESRRRRAGARGASPTASAAGATSPSE